MPRVLALGDASSLAVLLQEGGVELMRAPGTLRALGLAKELNPDLLLVAEGKDLEATLHIVATLSHDAVTRHLPILLLLDSSAPEGVRRGLETGAWDVLARGGDPIEARARLEALLRAKGERDEFVAEKQRATVLALAGAVAHKLNQPLTGISVIVDTLLAAHAREDLSRERLGSKLLELERLVERMASMVKRIAKVAEYRTVEYLGDVRILDLDESSDAVRKPSDESLRRPR